MPPATESVNPLVAVIASNAADLTLLLPATTTLTRFDVRHECWTVSPLGGPTAVAQAVDQALANGAEAFIVGVNGPSGLAATVAGHAFRPVLAVPLETAAFRGLDALAGAVQQPAGLPVAAVAIGQAGATNAALLAVAILGGSRPGLRQRLHAFRAEQAAKVLAATLP